VQTALGVDARRREASQLMLRDVLVPQHRAFFPLLPWLLVGSVNDSGQPDATLLAGPPGFVHAPDERHLRIDALPADDDPLAGRLRIGSAIGLLGLQAHTRRRNRANGTVVAVDDRGWTLRVDQSYGNCPKYIVPREARWLPPLRLGSAVHPSLSVGAFGARQHRENGRPDAHGLSDDAARLVAGADTCFVATAHPDAGEGTSPAQGVDMSHRGGPPGFVQRVGGNDLQLPDYPGNRLYNTLGNLQLNPLASLLFIDFDHRRAVTLSVRALAPQTGPVTTGDGRLPLADHAPPRRFEVLHTRWHRGVLPLGWHRLDEPVLW